MGKGFVNIPKFVISTHNKYLFSWHADHINVVKFSKHLLTANTYKAHLFWAWHYHGGGHFYLPWNFWYFLFLRLWRPSENDEIKNECITSNLKTCIKAISFWLEMLLNHEKMFVWNAPIESTDPVENWLWKSEFCNFWRLLCKFTIRPKFFFRAVNRPWA